MLHVTMLAGTTKLWLTAQQRKIHNVSILNENAVSMFPVKIDGRQVKRLRG
jgi:hypothetical protein